MDGSQRASKSRKRKNYQQLSDFDKTRDTTNAGMYKNGIMTTSFNNTKATEMQAHNGSSNASDRLYDDEQSQGCLLIEDKEESKHQVREQAKKPFSYEAPGNFKGQPQKQDHEHAQEDTVTPPEDYRKQSQKLENVILTKDLDIPDLREEVKGLKEENVRNTNAIEELNTKNNLLIEISERQEKRNERQEERNERQEERNERQEERINRMEDTINSLNEFIRANLSRKSSRHSESKNSTSGMIRPDSIVIGDSEGSRSASSTNSLENIKTGISDRVKTINPILRESQALSKPYTSLKKERSMTMK